MWFSFEDVTVGYRPWAPVLEHVSLRVGPGLWVVSGPNGSGKSTLLRCAAGVLRPQSGQICWDGETIQSNPVRYRWHLGYVPQEVEEFPYMRASDYLRHLALLKGIKPAFREGRVAEVLAQVHLEDGMPRLFSTGMKRRLALASALLNDPDLLILDEPAVGLDIQEKVSLRTLLADLAMERVILLSTHVTEELEGVADGRILVADKGVTLVDNHVAGAHQDLPGWRDRP